MLQVIDLLCLGSYMLGWHFTHILPKTCVALTKLKIVLTWICM